jgi:hypothetical protein
MTARNTSTLLECAVCKTRYHQMPGMRKCTFETSSSKPCGGALQPVKPVPKGKAK